MIDFGDDWAAEVAEISTDPEYQTIEVNVLGTVPYDPDLYDPVTGVDGNTGASAIYSGQARLIDVRWGSRVGNEVNPATVKSVRIQLPFNAVGRVPQGTIVHVTKAPRNPGLLTRVFRVTSDLQGGSAAARTLDCSVDEDGVR